VALALSGCDEGALWGGGGDVETSVSTPSGVQAGNVEVSYTLAGDEVTQTDVEVSYSKNGSSFTEATAGPGGDGTNNLTVTSSGALHTFVWNSGADLAEARESTVYLRVRPEEGSVGVSGSFFVYNARFLAAVEDAAIGRVRLNSFDVVAGDVTFRQSFATGGTDPYDIIEEGGFFFVAHETTNTVAALELDEENVTLVTAENSPYATGGVGAKYLASDGDHIFVSNTGSGTLSIFDLEPSTGVLTLSPYSGVAAAGCRSLVVRSSRLYVASETSGAILIFDIEETGELLTNGASPVTTGGLLSPRAMKRVGTRLYAANVATATLCGFNFQGGGGLAAIASSPFALTGAGVEQLDANDNKLFAVTGSAQRFLSMTVDLFGDVTEDVGFPAVLSGPAFGVQSSGSVVVAVTTTSEQFELWSITNTGTVVGSASSPVSAGVPLLRMATSE
jgi:hypothetical protein